MGIIIEDMDGKLMNLLQAGFPLSREPYVEIAQKLGLSDEEVLGRVSRLKKNGVIRVIGPVFNSRALGYDSTLAAMQVPENKIEEAAQIINQHPGVSHNYQRAHLFNLWFTVTLPESTDMDKELKNLERQIDPKVMLHLPSKKVYKIRLYFDLVGNGNDMTSSQAGIPQKHAPASLTQLERKVINEVQQQLPVTNRPFEVMAANVGVEPERFIIHLRSLLKRGIMRRFGASIEQQLAGFTSNEMVCWTVPATRSEEVGMKMATFKQVTHCYERQTNHHWAYNFYTMLHGKTREQNCQTVADIIKETGITDYATLATVRCFKKQRARYLV